MNDDHISTKCPCGGGQIIWKKDWKNMDGEVVFDHIDCLDCVDGKHVESFVSVFGHSERITLYLVPDSIEHMDEPRTRTPKSFLEHLIFLYPQDRLISLERTFKQYTRITDIPKDRSLTAVLDAQFRYEHSRKLVSIKKNLSDAIDMYQDYEYSYDKYIASIDSYRAYQKLVFDNSVLIEQPII